MDMGTKQWKVLRHNKFQRPFQIISTKVRRLHNLSICKSIRVKKIRLVCYLPASLDVAKNNTLRLTVQIELIDMLFTIRAQFRSDQCCEIRVKYNINGQKKPYYKSIACDNLLNFCMKTTKNNHNNSIL